MRGLRTPAAGILAVLSLGLAATVCASPRLVLVHVQQPQLAWADENLSHHVRQAFSRNQELRVHDADGWLTDGPAFPDHRTDIDSLVNWGLEAACRYLLVVTVDEEDLVRHKSFNLPLVFHRYETRAVVTGRYLLLDVQKAKVLAMKPFDVSIKGSAQFQGGTEDNRHDPGLHLTPVQKSRLFEALEKKLSEHLAKETAGHFRGR